jgi:hypothetical protein
MYRDGMLHYLLEVGPGTTAGGTELFLASAELP